MTLATNAMDTSPLSAYNRLETMLEDAKIAIVDGAENRAFLETVKTIYYVQTGEKYNVDMGLPLMMRAIAEDRNFCIVGLELSNAQVEYTKGFKMQGMFHDIGYAFILASTERSLDRAVKELG